MLLVLELWSGIVSSVFSAKLSITAGWSTVPLFLVVSYNGFVKAVSPSFETTGGSTFENNASPFWLNCKVPSGSSIFISKS